MWKADGGEHFSGPFFFNSWVSMVDPGVFFSGKRWNLFYTITEDEFYKQVFNLTYHLKQQVSSIYEWPTKLRYKMWELLEKQYEYEKKRVESK
jgi:hypothetical protein